MMLNIINLRGERMNQNYVPGMRVVIRDEEWLIRKVENNSQGGKTLYVQGLSRFVKDRESIFITNIEEEKNVKVIDPRETELIPDNSSYFRESKLYIESKLRKKTPTDDKLYIGHKAAMNLMNYQLEPSVLSLAKPRQRILIADAVGLGKTLEAGILMSELIARGKGKRILVVAVKSMMMQFQKEMWTRFTIPLKRLDSNEIQKIRKNTPSNHNPFYYHDKTIISMDTLKRDIEYRNYLENSRWDIIVIDEAHNVAKRGKKQAQRSRLAELLAKKSDTLIMLSATPHDGSAKSFASLMNMLVPTAIANEDDYVKEDIKGLVLRRFKKDVQDQVEGNFKERKIYKERCKSTEEEEALYDYFVDMNFETIDKTRNTTRLFKTTLKKSLFSSPTACMKTVEGRIKRISKKEDSNYSFDIRVLNELKEKLEKITPDKFSRYQKLIELIKSNDYNWDYKKSDDRIVIFTERIETMKFLKENLEKDLKLKPEMISELYGGMSDIEQQKIVDEFGSVDSKIRILVASDVASEGINLHYLSHRMIHFDIPWSLMVFQQRNGRIDRYGQEETPDIRYLVTETQNEKINGDNRILEVLINKEEQAEKNIGDPASLMDLYDIEAEEDKTAEAMDMGFSFEEFENSLDKEDDNPFMDLMNSNFDEDTKDGIDEKISSQKTIFGDIDYIEEGLKYLSQTEKIKYNFIDNSYGIEIEMPIDMKEKFKEIVPKENYPENDLLKLSSSIDTINREIKRSRQKTADTWPKYQYLWGQHPIIDWVNDKADIIYGRQESPVIKYDELDENESIFIMGGLIPNRNSNPMIDEWYGIKFKDNEVIDVIELNELLEMGVFKVNYPNKGNFEEEKIIKIKENLSLAVKRTEQLMKSEWKKFEDMTNPKLQFELDKLDKLREKHLSQLRLFEIKDELKTKEERKINEIFDEFLKWIEDTMILEKDNPYIHVVAVICG